MSTETATVLRLDLGSGPHPREGFIGVDQLAFSGAVTQTVDLGSAPWPWPGGSVSEANARHVIEHLTASQRTHFCNELYRVLVHGGTCRIQSPHWTSARAYGDPTHIWPPVSEEWLSYLNATWREMFAPHTDYRHYSSGLMCDFEASWQPAFTESIAVRHPDVQGHAARHYVNAINDIVIILTKR